MAQKCAWYDGTQDRREFRGEFPLCFVFHTLLDRTSFMHSWSRFCSKHASLPAIRIKMDWKSVRRSKSVSAAQRHHGARCIEGDKRVDLPGLDGRDHRFERLVHDRRSEEHTSELQSQR